MLVPPEIMNLTRVADTESLRYALGGIRFERDEEGVAHAVATDGHRLVHVTWNEDDGAEFPAVGVSAERVNGFETILSVDDCKEAQKLPPKRTPKPILQNILLSEPGANGEVTYAGTDLERKRVITARSLEGRYPRWRDVTPKPTTVGVAVSLNAKLLAELCDVVIKSAPIEDDDCYRIELIVRDGDSAVYINRKGEKANAEAVLMPLRKAA